MLRLKTRSLRVRLSLVILSSILPLLLLMLWSHLEGRRQITEDVQANALRLTRLVALHQRDRVKSTRELLTTLCEIPAVRSGNAEACSTLFGSLLQRLTQYVNICAVRPDGTVYADGLAGRGPRNLSSQPSFQRAIESGAFTIGEIGVCPVTGNPILWLAGPVLDENGRVRTVIFATLSMKWLDDIASSLMGSVGEGLPPGSVFTVRDSRGVILARYPGGREWVGQSMPDSPVLKAMLEHKGEGVLQTLGIDGVRRLYAYNPLPDGDHPEAYLSLGVSVDAAFKDADRRMLRTMAASGRSC